MVSLVRRTALAVFLATAAVVPGDADCGAGSYLAGRQAILVGVLPNCLKGRRVEFPGFTPLPQRQQFAPVQANRRQILRVSERPFNTGELDIMETKRTSELHEEVCYVCCLCYVCFGRIYGRPAVFCVASFVNEPSTQERKTAATRIRTKARM